MATIVTRSGKGSPLTNTEVDANFTNLNTELGTKADASSLASYQPLDGDLTSIAGLSGTTGLLRKSAANTFALDTAAYLTSFTETDPTVPSHVKAITTTNISNWNTAFGWGNHASAGYLTGITSGQVTTALGYTPANVAGDTFTGAVNLNGGATIWTGSTGLRLKRNPTSATGDDVLDIQVFDAEARFTLDNDNDGDNSLFTFGHMANGARVQTLAFDDVNVSWKGQKIFHDSYHPEADKWTTARTLSLSGDATGSVSWDGSANVTLPVAVVNDSHEHSFNSLLNKTGGTGTYTTSGDFRAPVFYDSNNTAYGVDPTGFSNLTTLYADRYFQRASGIPTANLGDPTVTEMALFDRQFNNKTAFYPSAKLKFFTSTDGVTWTEYTSFTDGMKKAFLGGDAISGVFIPNATPYFRIELTNDGNYVYLNALYIYWSASGNSSTVKIQKRRASDDAWLQHTNSSSTVSGWPAHLYMPFAAIPYISPTSTSASHFDTINIDFQPTWANANNIALYNMEVWGGYPAGSRNIYSTDSDKNVTFPTILGANTDIRAPIFYDSANTNYYVDPAGNSILGGNLTLQSTGSVTLTLEADTDNVTETDNPKIVFKQDGSAVVGRIGYASGENILEFINEYPDSLILGTSNSTDLTINGSGNVIAAVDVRAPIFYDSNDTAYYTNPNSTSNLLGLSVTNRITGSISGDAQRLFNHTGANNNSLQYWNTVDNTTLNPSAGYHYGLRMGHGDADTYYSATIAVDFFADNFYLRRKTGGTDQTWRRFWHNGDSTVSATGDFRAPIFYDSDNTGFYADFASANANAVYTNGGYSISAGDGKGFRFWNSDDYKIYMSASSNATWGGRVSGETTSDYNMYFRMKSGTNRGFVFRNDTTNVAGIDATGRIYSSGGRIYLNDATTNFIIAQADVSSALYLEARGGGFRVRNAGNGDSWFTALDGTCTATTDFRAPIFYDSANTAFYVDPASGSNLNGTLINNGGTAMTAGWNRNLMLASTFPVLVFNSANTKYSAIGVDHSGAAAGMRFWVNATSADAVTGTNAMNINTGNFVEAAGSFRAPIFYDSDNTAYYTNPAGASQMYTLNMGAGLTADNGGVARVTYPQGGAFSDSNNVLTGAIKIALPVSWTNTMMSLRIRVFDYSAGESFELHCGGYNYSPSTAWINTFAYIVGEASNDRNFNVRFGHDGTKCCILIGEVGSTWSYLKVVVEDVLLGHSGNAISDWDDGWAISTVTTLPTITSTRSNVQVGRFGNVFYDSDNTARFIDPSGTSSLTGLTVANTITGSVSGSSASTTGNAATATTLQTARTINGVSFNGSANITITAAANGGNAATVGGFTPSASSAVGSRVVVADPNGYIFNNYFNSTDNGVASGVTAVMVKCGDNYYRSATPAAIATFISGQVMGIAGNAATATTVSSITDITGLGRNSLSAGVVDGLTTTNFRTTMFGKNDSTYNIATSRWNSVPTAFGGLAAYGTAIAWSGLDTHGFLALNYNSAGAKIGGGNGNSIVWSADLLHSSNFTSYAMPSGSSATNSVDVRAPIFYDSNNTAYLVDPNGTSNVNALQVGGALTALAGNNYLNGHIYFSPYDADGNHYPHFNDGANSNGATVNWRIYSGSNLRVNIWDYNYNQFHTNVRAPIFYDSDNTGYYLDASSTGTSLNVAGSIIAAGNVTAYSDIRIKANVETIPDALDKLDQIRGVTYTRTDLDDTEQRYAGVIAQEIEKVLPEAVRDLGNIKAVDYNATIGLLIQAVKELRDEVETMKSRLH